MLKQFLSFSKILITLSLVLYIVHFIVVNKLLNEYSYFYPVYTIYFFLIVATSLIVVTILVIHKNYNDKTGFAFLAFSILKMLLVVIFLIPLITSDLTNKVPDILSFFIPYFIFLTLETVYILNLINKANSNQ